ncbi:MAG: hypothetical protein LQ350_005656 [Teloschistes chrysophthalmus]|nr:MAG: hypothetical protein LQ350_005656 [Niorma chrysophthalma]
MSIPPRKPISTPTLRQQPSNLSDFTVDSTSTFVDTPATAPTPGSPVHHRPGYQRLGSLNEQDTAYHGRQISQEHGLGITNLNSLPSSLPQARSTPGAPASANPLLSPPLLKSQIGYKRLDDDPIQEGDEGWEHDASQNEPFQPFRADSETESLRKQAPAPTFSCRTKKVQYSKGNWLAVSVLILSFYSTALSGVWLGAAIAKPRFGHAITTTGKIQPATASLLATGIAKSIELSFVTVFVTFLGQVLSRRALIKRSRGITIAEMSMRQWIMQPGTLITHWNAVRYAALTFLGMISLVGALTAMFYTTASDALVAPQLKAGPFERRQLYGRVATSFANLKYIKEGCQTPISEEMDHDYAGSTCISIEHAGQATAGYSRIVVNVSMAMPHSGVFAAARDPINQIMQPQDLNGLGEYDIQASVPSPSINVLCASMQPDELNSLVYSLWPMGNGTAMNVTGWPGSFDIPVWPSWLNQTPVDDLFEFGEKYGRRPPVFPKLPIPFNTVLNDTGRYTDSIYILATSEKSNYTMCSMRVSLTTQCSTQYHASLSGGSMKTRCEDPKDELAYGKSNTDATDGVISKDWAAVGTDWAKALSLGGGLVDSASSNGRLLTQLTMTEKALDPSLPSIAEALAVLSGCTLLLSTNNAPFYHFWNYSTAPPTLAEPQPQHFNASLRTHDYQCGGTQKWQGIFYIILLLAFVTNIVCLIYLLRRRGLVTDYIEPQNLFALSLNSPPSRALDGACGGGPEGEQLTMNWHIKMDCDREHFYLEHGNVSPRTMRRKTRPLDIEMDTSPVVKEYKKLSSRHSNLLIEGLTGIHFSPAITTNSVQRGPLPNPYPLANTPLSLRFEPPGRPLNHQDVQNCLGVGQRAIQVHLKKMGDGPIPRQVPGLSYGSRTVDIAISRSQRRYVPVVITYNDSSEILKAFSIKSVHEGDFQRWADVLVTATGQFVGQVLLAKIWGDE